MHNADEFLEYIAKNEKDLKKRLRKNITYEKELFDESFQESILKVYDSIVKNDVVVKDFLQYSFMSFKFNYINKQNKQRKKNSTHIDIAEYRDSEFFSYEGDNEDDNKAAYFLDDIVGRLNEECHPAYVRIYLDYYRMKCDGSGGYAAIAEEYNLTPGKVKEIVDGIDCFLKENFGDKYFTKF